eukprot:s2907_g5.t1
MDWKMRQQKREAISGRFWARIDRSKSKDTIPDEDSTIFSKSLPSKHSQKTKMRSGLQDLLFDDDRNPLSDAESALYSDSGEDDLDLVAVTIEKVKCRRVGTSMGLSHFFGGTTRNSVTGRIVMKEDRYLPGFLLVDIFGRRRLDHYIFRPYVMANRTWIYHKFAKDPSKLATVNAKDSMNGMIKKILELQCVDVDINSGRHSPLMLHPGRSRALNGPCLRLPAGDQKEKYNWVRLWLLPLRLVAATGIVLRTMELTQFVSVVVFSALSLLTLVVDFVFGDMFMLWSYRFECSYKVLDELPDRVISTEVTGSAWDPRYSLIADIRGLLCELRRPRLEELQELIETFQESQEDFGFFSIKCFSSDRPNFAAMEPDRSFWGRSLGLEGLRAVAFVRSRAALCSEAIPKSGAGYSNPRSGKNHRGSPEAVSLDLEHDQQGRPEISGTAGSGGSGATPLLAAAEKGFPELTGTLLRLRANRSVTDFEDRSLLHFAAPWPAILMPLLRELPAAMVLAQLRQQDTVGDTPLHRALAAARYDEVLEALHVLAQRGLTSADPTLLSNVTSLRNLAGEQLIHLNSKLELLEEIICGGCVKLLSLGADSASRTVAGAAPLHTAADPGSRDSSLDSAVLRVGEGDVLSLQISRTHAATVRPFAVVCGDGSVVTAGHGPSGGDSTAVQHRLRDVRSSQATEGSFAAILGDGSVLTWGDPESGGDSSEVMEQLTDVTAIQANMRAFAAIRRDGSVVTWGDVKFSADSGAVQEQLKGVHTRSQVYSGWTFAAIREDGSVVSWDGALMGSSCGADSSAVQHQLRDVRCLCATLEASAAILGDGSVDELKHNVRCIQSCECAFAAIVAGGLVVSWGHPDSGGDSSTVQDQLRDVTAIQATDAAFAALRSDGSVVTWGSSASGGRSSRVQSQLMNVEHIQRASRSFAALRSDGCVMLRHHLRLLW